MKRKSVYVETSVVSYLTARPSSNLFAAAKQAASAECWDAIVQKYDCAISQTVLDEISLGDANAAKARLAFVARMRVVSVSEKERGLALALLNGAALPAKAFVDALHIASVAVNRFDYLLTLNCKHIDNIHAKPLMRKILAEHGYTLPEIGAPQDLCEEDNHDQRSNH
jgi:predicted nucleic acid-binding protein